MSWMKSGEEKVDALTMETGNQPVTLQETLEGLGGGGGDGRTKGFSVEGKERAGGLRGGMEGRVGGGKMGCERRKESWTQGAVGPGMCFRRVQWRKEGPAVEWTYWGWERGGITVPGERPTVRGQSLPC